PAIILVLVHVFTPHYWVLASWKSGPQLPHGVLEDGRPWIGAEQPAVTVVEYVDYSCPHCALAASRMRIRVADHADTIRLVRHQQPRMRCLPAIPGQRCLYVRAAICAGDQDKFWEMDDWLFSHIPGVLRFDPEEASQDVGLELEAFTTCLDDEATFKRAEVEAKAARLKKIRETPMYEIDGEKLTPTGMVDELGRRL
ncbi:MAG: DsbA family protein, partial [Nannocystaceae bacterium]